MKILSRITYPLGHASKTALKELIEKVNPTKNYVYSYNHPALFESMFEGKVVSPKYLQSIEE
jgi:hypothetical protein